ncbi:BNR-4 repeat-containing protein [Echinimonas agarilytica]|uniref:BNR repeat-containing protein n=1 Tax=Echinimonas agarilytica TaxID=1215918 RepID=A0AA42B8M4_9GAMM|nr:BNR-4 repeat-containing protein [Echinimonas agarilytica]MCM2680708.1 BNR repeat-containing protein [Echinimonas agarilytica]
MLKFLQIKNLFVNRIAVASTVVLVAATLSSCAGDMQNAGAASLKSNSSMVNYFADNGTGNPLAVVQHPAGEYHEGITYVAYQGPFEDPYVAAYNHDTQTWLGPFRAGTSELGRRAERTKWDNHGKPTLLIDNDGYIHIFYGGHGGDKHHGQNTLGNVHHGANKHSISKQPLDISGWDEVDNTSVFGTYNQALKMDNGDIYLFYRHGAHRSDWVYQKSTDNGRTFEAPVSFLKHKRRDDIEAVDSWYAWVGHGNGDDLIVSFDYHVCWDGSANERGHTTERHDAHFMVFDTKTDTWTNVIEQELEMPLTREAAEKQTLAMDTGDHWTFNGSTYLDDKGNPHLAINVGVDLGQKTGGPKQTRHVHWDGQAWQVGASVNGQTTGVSRGDFKLDAANGITYFLVDQDGKEGVLATWNSQDSGRSFTKQTELLRAHNGSFSITSLIKNAHPDAQVLVAEKARGKADRKIYLVGEKGPVQRPLLHATLDKDTSTFKKK